MKKLGISIFLFLGFCVNGQVIGIINEKTNEPIAGAIIRIQCASVSYPAKTDSTGYATFPDSVSCPEWHIRVNAENFITRHYKLSSVSDTILISLTSKDVELGEVVVTGTLKEVSKQNSTIPVESYSGVFFKKNQSSNLFENISMVNGVRPQINCNVCNTGDIHINGMEGPYSMVMVDGMVNVSGLSTVYGLSGIPSSMIERVEISKGPASTLYGSEALAGVINVITKNPNKAPRAYWNVFYTNLGELNADASLAGSNKKLSSMLGINYFRFQTTQDINKDNFTDVTQQHRISVFNKWQLKRKDNRKAMLGLRYYYEDRWGGEMQWTPEFRGTDSIYGESIYTARYELLGKYQLPVNKIRLFYDVSANWHHQNSVYGNVPFIADQGIAFQQLYWDANWGPRHDALVGASLRYTVLDDNTIATYDSASVKNSPSQVWLPGIFIQDDYSLHENHKILGGLRYDFNSVHGSILTPRLAYKASIKRSVFRFSLGNGFRVVNVFTEDHAALTSARRVVLAEKLKPERSWNATVNFLQKFFPGEKHFFGVDFSLFITRFSNQIVPDYSDPEKIIYANLNGYAIARGASVNLEYTYSDRIKAHAGLTWVRSFRMDKDSLGEYERINQLLSPVFSSTFTITYILPKWRTEIHYTGIIYGPMDLPVFPNDYRVAKSPTYTVQNIQVNKKVSKNFEVYAACKNLFNFYPKSDVILRPFDPFDKYIQFNNPYNYTFDPTYNYAQMQGRKFMIGLNWTLM